MKHSLKTDAMAIQEYFVSEETHMPCKFHSKDPEFLGMHVFRFRSISSGPSPVAWDAASVAEEENKLWLGQRKTERRGNLIPR